MSLLRSLSASLLSAAFSFAVVTGSGCATDAVGVDDCRDIERARCSAGKACGTVTDVSACQRYYRDHCLHGLSGPRPARARVSECVRVIEAAGACASEDPTIELVACAEPVTEPRPNLTTACQVVEHPERAEECAFLLDEPPEEPDGEGGAPADEPNDGGAGSGTE